MGQEYEGGSVKYYAVDITAPINSKADPYTAECLDIIEALDMDWAEANAFKAIWRKASARTLGKSKKGYDDGLYDAQKVAFYGSRMVARAERGDIQKGLQQIPAQQPDQEWIDGDCWQVLKADGKNPAPGQTIMILAGSDRIKIGPGPSGHCNWQAGTSITHWRAFNV